MAEGALILYGRGGGLCNFKYFVDDLITLDAKEKFASKVKSAHTTRRADAISHIESCPFSIKELHIFTHSIGGGLFLSYGESTMSHARNVTFQKAAKLGRKVTYNEVVDTEVGAILSDHLIQPSLAGKKSVLQKKFAAGATIKIWGCNSGIPNWTYNDDGGSFYWEALNLKNTPKPAIAQAIANYFNVETFGAESGASIQVKHKGRWIYADQYKRYTGKYAGEPETLRLNPTKGTFVSYKPVP
jgi:hypothetical protein